MQLDVSPVSQGDSAPCRLCSSLVTPRDFGSQEVSEADGVLQITEQLLIFLRCVFFRFPGPILSIPVFVSSLLLMTSAVQAPAETF